MKTHKKLFYDFIGYESYGGGGYWKLNKQKVFNATISVIIGVLIFIIIFLK